LVESSQVKRCSCGTGTRYGVLVSNSSWKETFWHSA